MTRIPNSSPLAPASLRGAMASPAVEGPPSAVEARAPAIAPALDRFEAQSGPGERTAPRGPGADAAGEDAVSSPGGQRNVTLDLGQGVERSAFARQTELYSGTLSAELISQRGPMSGSHTARRDTAVAALDFADTRGFFGGAALIEVELVPQHTLIERGVTGGHMTEQRRTGVLGAPVRVALEREDDGVYRARAPANHAFFQASSETGYARQILEDVRVSIHGGDGREDSAFGARYSLLGA